VGNPFVYVQLQTGDLPAAVRFYGAVFDWELTETSQAPRYVEIEVGEGTAGGLMERGDERRPSQWVPYVVVDDMDAVLERAAKLGAGVLVPKTELPERWYSVIVDPTGAPIALTQPREP
jgi:uncharacterized protein